MKIVIDLKDSAKTQSFKKDDVLLFDGKKWYVTTKSSLLEDLEKRYNLAVAKIDRKMAELDQKYATFMQQYNEQNAKLLPIIEHLLAEDEEK